MTVLGASANLNENRRQSLRRRTLLRGKIVYGSGAYSIDCTIRDMSDTGARIVVPEGQMVPRHFFLIDMRNRVAHETEMRWRAVATIGVQVLRSFSLEAQLPPELQFLQRLWSGSFAGFSPGPYSTARPRQLP